MDNPKMAQDLSWMTEADWLEYDRRQIEKDKQQLKEAQARVQQRNEIAAAEFDRARRARR